MVITDIGILVYAVGDEHEYRAPCRQLIDRVRQGALHLYTTVEVIQEFAHVRSRRRPLAATAALAQEYAAMFSLLVVTPLDLELGLTFFETSQRLGAFDCVLAAVAVNNRAEALISADQAFADIPGLHWFDPRSPDVANLR